MTSDSALVGLRVAEARRRRGLTQVDLARDTDLDRSALAKIETGSRRVSALELSRISAALGERVEWFLEPPIPEVVSHRNTVAPGENEETIDVAIDRLARQVDFVRSMSLPTTMSTFATLPRAADVETVERDAQVVRERLALTSDQPLLECGRAAESLGLLAFSALLPAGAADAATVLLERGAVSLINGGLHVGRRRLALAHEIGHFVYADKYSIDLRVGAETPSSVWESRIDRFARALLLPAHGLRQMWADLLGRDDLLRTVAVRTASAFRVDMSTLARRLEELDVVAGPDAAAIRSYRTTKTDIVEYDLVVQDELMPPWLPRSYQLAVLAAVRAEKVSPARGIELLMGSFDFDSLPEAPLLPPESMWQFV